MKSVATCVLFALFISTAFAQVADPGAQNSQKVAQAARNAFFECVSKFAREHHVSPLTATELSEASIGSCQELLNEFQQDATNALNGPNRFEMAQQTTDEIVVMAKRRVLFILAQKPNS